jgi:hypothetical protein
MLSKDNSIDTSNSTMSIITENDIEPCQIGKTVLTTLTNYGYLLYTLNMLKSLEPFGLDKKVLVIAIDEKAHAMIKQRGYHSVCLHEHLSAFHPWNTRGYDTICYYKIQMIHYIMSLNKNILLLDGDLVFQQNPKNDIEEWNESDEDIWIQNDGTDDDNTTNMCTGYMMIRSNEKMIALYEIDRAAKLYSECALDNNDQTYFNTFVKPYCTIAALPLRLYPNGNVFYNVAEVHASAILVHFNWVKGHKKLVKMKEHQMWLLTPEEEII